MERGARSSISYLWLMNLGMPALKGYQSHHFPQLCPESQRERLKPLCPIPIIPFNAKNGKNPLDKTRTHYQIASGIATSPHLQQPNDTILQHLERHARKAEHEHFSNLLTLAGTTRAHPIAPCLLPPLLPAAQQLHASS